MSLVRNNIIANLFGSMWLAVMSFIFIPVYINFLGVAAWGLIGIFSTLQVVFSLLDMGLSSTLNREMARLSQVKDSGQVMRNLLKTLEWVYWCLAFLVLIANFFLAPLIAKYWINSSFLSVATIRQSLVLMGIVIALQLPIALYSGGFMGLQKQVLLSSINVLISTFRSVGAVLILWLVSPTIHSFFLWQIVTSILNVLLLIIILWKNLPASESKASFKLNLLKGIWKFAVGMSGISILGIILAQLDKIVLSKLIALDDFGYYMLANAVAMSIGRLISPIFFSIYPKFTQLVAGNKQLELKNLYHKIAQLVSVLIFPIAIVLVFFSYDILLLWTKDPLLAQRSYVIVNILLGGSVINAIMHPPYALQLAFGWTKLSFFKNIIAIIIIVPLIIYLAKKYGPVGAAIAWLILNIGYLIFEIGVMHLRLLKVEKRRWYLQDVFLPLTISLIIVFVAKWGLGHNYLSPVFRVIFLAGTLIVTMAVTAFVTPLTREVMVETLSRKKFLKNT